jgi:molybdopterin-guanine dinucleotide biosynthesis protein A
MTRVIGLVLAGGQSRRMGRSDKALMKLGKMPMIEHALRRLRAEVDTILINTNADPAPFALYGHTVLADTVPGFAGPLAGILNGLTYARARGYDAVVSVAADTPFFPDDLLSRFQTCGPRDIVLASSDGHRHPTFGLWSVSIESALANFLSDGEDRKIMRFVQQTKWDTVEFPLGEVGMDPFFNINTPEDLARAETLLELSDG